MLKVLQISDLHILPNSTDTLLGVNTEYYFRKVLEQAHQEHGRFDLILVTGDLAQQPCSESYQRIFDILYSYQTKTLCLPGNHDDLSCMVQHLHTALISCQKYLQLSNWQIICLNSQKTDSPVGELANTELAFLIDCLDNNANKPTLIAVHHHCINSGSAWLDTMKIINSDTLWSILTKYPQVKAICFGHIHQEISGYQQSIAYFSAPASCFQFQTKSKIFSIANKNAGYRVLNLHADGKLETHCYWLNEPLIGLQKTNQVY